MKKISEKKKLAAWKRKVEKFVDIEEFRSLTFGLSVDQVADLTGYHPTSVRKWYVGSAPVPFCVFQLFSLRRNGVLGKDWENWRFGSDGLLYHPFWRRGFNGHELAGMWYENQMRYGMEFRIRELSEQVKRLPKKLEDAENQVFFYKSQVTLEAKLGLALSRIAA